MGFVQCVRITSFRSLKVGGTDGTSSPNLASVSRTETSERSTLRRLLRMDGSHGAGIRWLNQDNVDRLPRRDPGPESSGGLDPHIGGEVWG